MSKEARKTVPGCSDAVGKKLNELAELVALEKYGSEGPGKDLTFSEIEELGHRVGQLAALTVDQTVQSKHAEHFASNQPCPQCGRLCPVSKSERDLQTLDGEASFTEPRCDCPDCDRAFFP